MPSLNDIRTSRPHNTLTSHLKRSIMMGDPVESLYDERVIIALFPGYQPVRREGKARRGHDEDETGTRNSNEAVPTAIPNQGVHGTNGPRAIHSSVARDLTALGRLGFDAELNDPALREDYQQISRDLAQTLGADDQTNPPSHGTVGHPENGLAYGELTRLAAQHEGNLDRATATAEQYAIQSLHRLQPLKEPARAQDNTPCGCTHPAGFEERLRQAVMPPTHVQQQATRSITQSITSSEDVEGSYRLLPTTASPVMSSRTSFSTGGVHTPQTALSSSPQASSPSLPLQVGQTFTCSHYACRKKDYGWELPNQFNKHWKNCHTPEHEKQFGCDVCPKRYVWNKDLERHLRTHADGRPFLCSRCDHPFTRADNMARHFTTCGNSVASPSPSSRGSKKRRRQT